jgi:GT2 family glycosyltransferase
MSQKNDISFLIVTYNNEKTIERCIKSLLKVLPKDSEIIVFDNASADQTLNKLKNIGNRINLIESKNNLGYGKGNNLAAKSAKCEYIFILNPDTEIKAVDFHKIIEFYESDPKIGLIAPRLMLLTGKVQASVKKMPSVWGAFKEYILGIKYSYSEYYPSGVTPIEVEAAYGAALLIKKSLFEKVGGFDEKYFLYYEDIDLCRKLKKIGKKIFYFPNVEIIHLVGGSKSNQNRYNLNYDSALKYHGFVNTFLLQIIFKVRRLFT